MKRFYSNLLILAIAALSTLSCKKFLDRPPEGQLGEDEAFKTEADVVAFSNGAFTLFSNAEFYSGRHQVLNELLGDHYKGDRFTGDYAEIFKRQNSFFGGTRDGHYKLLYRIIADANLILKHLDLATDPIVKSTLEGEAKLYRAIAHFELVRMYAQPWGYSPDNSHLGVPVRTAIDLGSQPRATVKQVYEQVIADLKDAEGFLPAALASGKFYKPTSWAAKAFLAKVYFQQNDFTNAYAYANQVIASNKFTLDASFASRFSLGLSTEGILVLADQTSPAQFNPGGDLRGNFRSDLAIPGFTFTDIFYGVATSRAADLRKAWYSNTLQAGFNVLTKYNKNFFDLPIVHLTEIKLIRAEAGAETGGANLAVAITDINDITTRAYGGTTFNLPVNATAAAVIATARYERELEMVGEGNRTQEIKRIGARNGTSVDRRGSVWNCNGFILQFPKAEKDANSNFIMNVEGGCL